MNTEVILIKVNRFFQYMEIFIYIYVIRVYASLLLLVYKNKRQYFIKRILRYKVRKIYFMNDSFKLKEINKINVRPI
jgi:hypothetical protein